MWITTKSIVKEIKKNQEDFVVQLEKIVVEQRKEAETLQKQIAVLVERMNCLEKLNSEDRERNNSNYSEFVRLIEDINKLLNDLQRNIVTEFESGTQRVNDQIISFSQNETKVILESIQKSLDRVSENLEDSAGQCENHLKTEIQKVKDYSTTVGEKNTSLIMDELTSKFEQVEKIVQGAGNKVVRETTSRCNDISDELKGIRCAIKDMTALSENQDGVVSENIETMSVAMQEIMRGLLALDEANRLIIAKLLLKDMEI